MLSEPPTTGPGTTEEVAEAATTPGTGPSEFRSTAIISYTLPLVG